MVRKKQTTLKWVQGNRQLSDVMTKQGVSSKPLLTVIAAWSIIHLLKEWKHNFVNSKENIMLSCLVNL